MVKKTASMLLLFIYSLATVGATVHMHYCMDKYVGWSLYQSKNEKCGKCGMQKDASKGCCKDEHKYIQFKKEHQQPPGSFIIPDFNQDAILNHPVTSRCNFGSCLNESCPIIHGPPLTNKLRSHILHCTYLI